MVKITMNWLEVYTSLVIHGYLRLEEDGWKIYNK